MAQYLTHLEGLLALCHRAVQMAQPHPMVHLVQLVPVTQQVQDFLCHLWVPEVLEGQYHLESQVVLMVLSGQKVLWSQVLPLHLSVQNIKITNKWFDFCIQNNNSVYIFLINLMNLKHGCRMDSMVQRSAILNQPIINKS